VVEVLIEISSIYFSLPSARSVGNTFLRLVSEWSTHSREEVCHQIIIPWMNLLDLEIFNLFSEFLLLEENELIPISSMPLLAH